MAEWVDYFSILRVRPDAGPEDIRISYKKLCKLYHPDVNPSPSAADIMKKVNLAYGVLSNPESRKRYYAEWLRRDIARTAVKVAKTAEKNVVRKNPVRSKYSADAKEQNQTGSPSAESSVPRWVITDYFTALSHGNFGVAFSLLSREDRSNFDFLSYNEWQELVFSIYQILSFSIQHYKTYEYKINNNRYMAEEYTISVAEKDKSTGKVDEYSFTKTVILEDGIWRVYLGYRDLTPLIKQFKSDTETKEDITSRSQWLKYKSVTDLVTGLPNINGFEELIKPEIYRYKRYGRSFSIGILQVFLPEKAQDSEKPSGLFEFIGYIAKGAVRVVDTVAYIGDGRYVFIFSETNKKSAGHALRRVGKAIKRDVGSCFDINVEISMGVSAYGGEDTKDLLEACIKSIS